MKNAQTRLRDGLKEIDAPAARIRYGFILLPQPVVALFILQLADTDTEWSHRTTPWLGPLVSVAAIATIPVGTGGAKQPGKASAKNGFQSGTIAYHCWQIYNPLRTIHPELKWEIKNLRSNGFASATF